eukprot:9743759-Prorocentrum_lima.AAC.1
MIDAIISEHPSVSPDDFMITLHTSLEFDDTRHEDLISKCVSGLSHKGGIQLEFGTWIRESGGLGDNSY